MPSRLIHRRSFIEQRPAPGQYSTGGNMPVAHRTSEPATEEMDMDKHMAKMQENMNRARQQMNWIRRCRDFRF